MIRENWLRSHHNTCVIIYVCIFHRGNGANERNSIQFPPSCLVLFVIYILILLKYGIMHYSTTPCSHFSLTMSRGITTISQFVFLFACVCLVHYFFFLLSFLVLVCVQHGGSHFPSVLFVSQLFIVHFPCTDLFYTSTQHTIFAIAYILCNIYFDIRSILINEANTENSQHIR